MASGSFSTKYSGWTYKIEWSSTPSTVDNKSTITCVHKLVCASGYDLYIGSRSNSCTAGETKSFTSPSISTTGGKTITLGTTKHTVSHRDDGTQSVTITGTFNIKATLSGTYKASITASKKVDLDTIPRKATITSAPNFNDEENPTIGYSNLAGTAVSTLQACISLDGSKDDIAYRDISKTGTSYTFNLTDTERNILQKATTTSNTRAVKFYVKTVIGSTTFYSNVEKTLTIINNKPVFTDSQLSYADTDTSVTTVTQNPLMIVQNKSNLKVTYTAATAKKYATISQYSFTLNGVTKISKTAGGTVDFGKINSESDLTLSVTIADSRGNTISASKTIKCYKYYTPSVTNFKAYRVKDENGQIDANGTWLKCEYTTNIASVDGTNQRIMYITGVGDEPILVAGNTAFINLNGDRDNTYHVSMILTDLYSPNNPVYSNIDAVYGSSRIINVHPSGTGIAFGKKAEKSELFECLWDANFIDNVSILGDTSMTGDVSILGDVSIKNKSLIDIIHPVGSVFITSTNTNPSSTLGGTWSLINKSFTPYAGTGSDFFTAESNISEVSCAVIRNDSTIRIRLNCTLGYNVTDTSTLIGTFNWSNIGVDKIRYALYQYPAGCDGGGATVLCQIGAEQGELQTVEAVGYNKGNSTSGQSMYLDFTVPVQSEDMIDSFCNAFHWRRTK